MNETILEINNLCEEYESVNVKQVCATKLTNLVMFDYLQLKLV